MAETIHEFPLLGLIEKNPSAEQFREFMARASTWLLEQMPGNSIKPKLPILAHQLGMDERRLNSYRYQEVNRPSADEVWTVIELGKRIAASNEVRAELRRNNKELLDAFNGVGDPSARRASLLRIAGEAVADGTDRAAGTGASGQGGASNSSLGRFAGGILSVEEIGLAYAARAHQQLVELIDQTAGEFTAAAAGEMERLGLIGLSWLYRAEEALTTLHVGDDVPIILTEDRSRILYRPLMEQPLPPSMLSVVADHLRAVMQPHARPTVHRITAEIAGRVLTWDRAAALWGRSDLITGSCVMVPA